MKSCKVLFMLMALVVFILLMSTTTFADTVGLWHFDEGSGLTAYDSSGYGNHGTLDMSYGTPPAWVSPGYDGNNFALDFPYEDDTMVIVPDSNSLSMEGTSEFTLQAWIKPETWNHNSRIVGKNGYELWCAINDGNNVMRAQLFFAEDTTYYWFYSDANIPMNEWTHIALTYNGLDITVWLNGSEDTVVNRPGKTLKKIEEGLYIGNRAAGGRPFDGLIDEVQVDDTAPAPADCAEVWARGLGIAADLDQDCYVNMFDFTKLAQRWLECNDPNDPNCPSPE